MADTNLQDGPARSGGVDFRISIGATVLMALVVGLVALGVRVAYRIDNAAAFDRIMPAQSFISHRKALDILDGKGVVFSEDADPAKLKQIRRPPGYAVFLAASYCVVGRDLRTAQLVQIGIDALVASLLAAGTAALARHLVRRFSAVAAVPSAGRLERFRTRLRGIAGLNPHTAGLIAGGVAGGLYAISPHQAYYAMLVTPDLPVVWPVLAGAALLMVSVVRNGRESFVEAGIGGVLLGASCWLTAQGMTLPVAALALLPLVARRGARRRALALGAVAVGVAALVVAPLAIRNAAVYGTLAPIRPGLGTTLLEGLGVYDARFPATDGALLEDEAARFGRPDYGEALYQPDGAARERDRLRRALDAIGERPLWFVSLMVDRADLIFSYDHAGSPPWPRNTAVVAPVSAEGDGMWRMGRRIVSGAQAAIFRTWLVRTLAIAALVLLVAAGSWRAAALLLVVPAHHALVGSLVLTEYKYTLPIHPWVFAIVGLGVGLAAAWLTAAVNSRARST